MSYSLIERKLSPLIGSGLQCKTFSEENNYYAYTSSLSQATIAFSSLPHPFPLRINCWKIYLTTTVNKTQPSFLWVMNRLLIFILFIYNEINFLTILNPSLCSPRCNIGQIPKFRCTLLSWRSLPKFVVAAFTTLGVSFPQTLSLHVGCDPGPWKFWMFSNIIQLPNASLSSVFRLWLKINERIDCKSSAVRSYSCLFLLSWRERGVSENSYWLNRLLNSFDQYNTKITFCSWW